MRQNYDARKGNSTPMKTEAPMRIGKVETLGKPTNMDAVRKAANAGKRE